jgi:hypothetical protein
MALNCSFVSFAARALPPKRANAEIVSTFFIPNHIMIGTTPPYDRGESKRNELAPICRQLITHLSRAANDPEAPIGKYTRVGARFFAFRAGEASTDAEASGERELVARDDETRLSGHFLRVRAQRNEVAEAFQHAVDDCGVGLAVDLTLRCPAISSAFGRRASSVAARIRARPVLKASGTRKRVAYGSPW